MKILISSYPFYPSVGGLEEVTDIIARHFVSEGHAVKIVTMTPATEESEFPFEIIRRPAPLALIRAIRWCDVYLQQNISLRLGWPLLFMRRPWVIAQHGPFVAHGARASWKRLIKWICARFADRLVACSSYVAKGIGSKVEVISNPYRDQQFRVLPNGDRPTDLVFLGRLVSDKGAIILVEALGILRERGIAPALLVIGEGPERGSLQARCQALGLSDQVRFAGAVQGEPLVKLLNQCQIMVIPSVWEEPFGVVALEGIACGCVVIAARAGGLPEAVGPCGLLFERANASELARAITLLLGDKRQIGILRTDAPSHLAGHQSAAAAGAYLRVLSEVYSSGRPHLSPTEQR